MKKWAIWALIVCALFALTGCQKVTFEGEKISDADQYTLSFGILNMTDIHTFTLAEGDRLSVEIALTNGQIDLAVTDPDGESAYRGDSAENGSFELRIVKTGTYTCSVSGRDASGRVVFSVLRQTDAAR